MNRFTAYSLVALTLLFGGAVGGCVTKIQVIEDGPSNTNKMHKVESGFNEETYVWEGWTFSTNRVDR